MGIFSQIFGGNATSETVLEVERLIAAMDREVDAAKRQIVEIDTRRPALLIADDDAALDSDQIARERASRTIERAELARRDLSTRLKEARERARQALIVDLQAERAELVDELILAFEAAVEVNERAEAFFDKTRALIGHSPVPGLHDAIAYPLLQRSMVAPWRDYVARLAGPVHRPATFPQKVAAMVAPKAKPADTRPYAETVTRRRPELPTAPDGTMRIQMVRANVEIPGFGVSQIGDVLDMPATVALAMLQNGAADLAPEGSEARNAAPEIKAPGETPDKPKRARKAAEIEGNA